MDATTLFAGIAVADLDAARGWYERFAGRPADLVPNEREFCWQLTDTGWIYVVTDAERAGRSLVTLLVSDLDEWLVNLAGRGLAAETVDTIPGAVRKAAFRDPEGNMITLGQPLTQD
jgi:catechol 2,3-dioxygenase-like lactoylglutathione lyase family enzyme